MKDKNSTIIYGAGNAGIRLAKKLKINQKIRYFVDDDFNKIGKKILNIKIISYKDLVLISKENKLLNLIVAIPSLSIIERNNLFKRLYSITDTITALPTNKELINDKIEIADLSKISFTEIINRKNFEIEYKKLKYLNKKNILVTGAAGSIGSELCRQLSKLNTSNLIFLDLSENSLSKLINSEKIQKKRNIKYLIGNILDTNSIKKIILKYNINIIFHAAAYKHVDLLEDNIVQAAKNNTIGTYSMLEASRISNNKVKFVYISTDKAVKPIGILGYSKGFGEVICQNFFNKIKKMDITIVRFGNVFASDGSYFDKITDQIKLKNIINLTHKKMERFFMSTEEACYLVLKSLTISSKEKLYILNMGKPVKILNLIQKLIKMINKGTKIKIIGIRKGEKLKENLSYKKMTKTSDKFIFSTKNPKIKNPRYLKYFFKDLIDEIKSENGKKIKKMFKDFYKIYERN